MRTGYLRLPYRILLSEYLRIDISMGMLQKGMTYILQDSIAGIHLARARFMVRAISRRASAPLAVTTFVAGNSVLTHMMERRKNLHVFELPDLQRDRAEAGFEGFVSKRDGDFIMFSTRKAALRQ